MAWPWSSRACATSDTDQFRPQRLCRPRFGPHSFCLSGVLISIVLTFFLLSGISCGELIFAEDDIQAALDLADPGDTVMVGSGQYESFLVDKPLTIIGDGAKVSAQLQEPAIIIESGSVSISGFEVEGFPENPEAKFGYYMGALDRSRSLEVGHGYRLNLPNAAILIFGGDAIVKEIQVEDAEVGIFVEDACNVSFQNCTIERCDTGIELLRCSEGQVESTHFDKCDKYGLYIEGCDEILATKNGFVDTTNAGLLLKRSFDCKVENNLFSGNRQGLFLWNSSFNLIKENWADGNLYYGMVISDESCNNSIVDNLARNNGGSGSFGVGISLQENSSHNWVARNVVEKNMNGLELTKGCEFNLICCNNATGNSNAIRLDKNQNNLVCRNNFQRNMINAYDNASHNFWNGTLGNYYDDYRGRDKDGDGIGDDPYWIPKGSSCAVDWRPLTSPGPGVFDLDTGKAELLRYADYLPKEDLPYKVENDVIKIGTKSPTIWWR